MNLIDFIYKSNDTRIPEDLTDLFLKYLNNFGIDRFIMGDLSYDLTFDKEQKLDLLANYPEEWLKYYKSRHYVNYDPVYQKGLNASTPFTWEEVLKENISKKSIRVMDEAREHALYGGIGLTIHRPLGKIIGLGLSASENGIRYDADTISLVNIASHQFFTVYSDLIHYDELDRNTVKLTNREREVLLWIAKGKTKSDIARILGVSESSIKRHCENLFVKLEVNNLPHAVARAIRTGLINFYLYFNSFHWPFGQFANFINYDILPFLHGEGLPILP